MYRVYLHICLDKGVPRWEWADGGGEMGVGRWGEEMGVTRWKWAHGGG